jgi:hypothetical protein
MAWRDACENYNIYYYICMQFGTILDALEDNSFMIFYAHSGMNERNSSLEVFLRIWHNLTVKHRDLKEKNGRLQKRDTTHNSWTPNSTQSAHRWSPVIQKLDCDTQSDDQPSNASLVRNPGDCFARGDPSGWPGWSQPPEIVTCHVYTSDSRAVAFILHWMWCQTQFPRHRSAHCVRNRIITRKNKRHDQNISKLISTQI